MNAYLLHLLHFWEFIKLLSFLQVFMRVEAEALWHQFVKYRNLQYVGMNLLAYCFRFRRLILKSVSTGL